MPRAGPAQRPSLPPSEIVPSRDVRARAGDRTDRRRPGTGAQEGDAAPTWTGSSFHVPERHRSRLPAVAAPSEHVVAIDALAARFGGTAYAAVEIAKALARHDRVAHVGVATRPGAIVERGLRSHAGITILTVRRLSAASSSSAWPGRLVDSTKRSRAWGSTGLLSMSGMLPRTPRVPYVCLQANPLPYQDEHRPASPIRRWALNAPPATRPRRSCPHVMSRSWSETFLGVRIVPWVSTGLRFAPSAGRGHELLCVGDF